MKEVDECGYELGYGRSQIYITRKDIDKFFDIIYEKIKKIFNIIQFKELINMKIYDFLEEMIAKKELYKIIEGVNFTLNDYKDLASKDGKYYQNQYYFNGNAIPITSIMIYFSVDTPTYKPDILYPDPNGTEIVGDKHYHWASSIIYNVRMNIYMTPHDNNSWINLYHCHLNDYFQENMKTEMYKYAVPVYTPYNKEEISPSQDQIKLVRENINNLIENECKNFYYKYLKDNISETDHNELNRRVKDCERKIHKIRREIDRYNNIMSCLKS